MTKFNATRRKRIVQAIRAGNYASTAFAWAGISETQYYKWLKRGKEALAKGDTNDLYAVFYQEVEEAKAAAEVHNVAVIQKPRRNSGRQVHGCLREDTPIDGGATINTE